MLKQYCIADTHFGHQNVLKFEAPTRGHFASIEDHDRDLKERWNAVIKPKDTVWHLGDVFLGKDIVGSFNSITVNDPRYVCVSAEHTNLTPILLTEACGYKE